LDNNSGKGRRVDLNMTPNFVLINDTTTIGGNRSILQALLWAGRKIPGVGQTTLFNPNSIKLNKKCKFKQNQIIIINQIETKEKVN
jgi:hypothetical protein